MRSIGFGCLGLLLATGLGWWIAGDWLAVEVPRRAIAAILSERLAVQIRIDRIEILDHDRVLLSGLSMAGFRDLPFIEHLQIEELVVEASLSGVLDNRFDRLRFRGVSARLAPAPRVVSTDSPLPRIGELILEPASIRLAAGPEREDLLLCAQAVVRDVGEPAGRQAESSASAFGTGEVRVSAAALELGPLYALMSEPAPGLEARIADLDLELTFDAAGERLTAGATSARLLDGAEDMAPATGGGLELSRPRFTAERLGQTTEMRLGGEQLTAWLDDRPVTTDRPSVDVTVTEDPGGMLDVELVPHLPWLAGGRLTTTWDTARGGPRSFDGRLRGLDLGAVLATLDPLSLDLPLARLEAIASADLRTAGDRLDYRLEIAARELASGELELEKLDGSAVRVHGSLPFDPLAEPPVPAGDGPLQAVIEIPAGRGRWGSLTLPSAAFPLTARFTGRWLGDPVDCDAAVPDATSFTGGYQLDSATAGRLAANGRVAIACGQPQADLTWAWTHVELGPLVRLLRDAGLDLPELELEGKGQARGRLHLAPATVPVFQGTLDLERFEVAGEIGSEVLRWNAGESTADWRWTAGPTPIELSTLTTSGALTAPGVATLDLELRASGQFAADLAHGRLASTILEAPAAQEESVPAAGLGTVHVTGDWRQPPDASTEVSARLSLEGFDLSRLQPLVAPLAEAEALADIRLAGIASADLEVTLADTAWHLAGPARLESAGFTSLDGSRVAEGLSSRFDLELRGADSAPTELEARGRLGGFLLLWNTFFGDFSGIEASLAARARIEPAGDGPLRWHLALESALADGPMVAAALSEDGTDRRYTLHLDVADLAATHQRYLAPLLEQQLGRVELGGRLAARIRGSAMPATWSTIGDLEIRDLRITSGGGQATVAGLDLDLPLHLRRSPGPELELSGPRLTGRLAFDQLAVRGLELPPIASDLAVEADSVGLEKPVVLSVLGGTVALERLTLKQLARPSRHLESGIELAGIRLERISDELELLPLEGELNGRLAGVRLSPSLLAVDGGGEIEAFGGTIEVRDISGQDVLSRFPKLSLSADFSDIDLGALTRRLDFGEMTGILQGSLEDLELFRGVPVRFSAHLETIHRKGVPRTVDVKAVNNITILGTGQRASVLDRGIQKFFDRYTYDRLGVSMRLDRDVLLLRGLEQRNDRELFLRGRLPFRIDVVNAQPGKTVSFQTMVGRLQSLDFASARTDPAPEPQTP